MKESRSLILGQENEHHIKLLTWRIPELGRKSHSSSYIQASGSIAVQRTRRTPTVARGRPLWMTLSSSLWVNCESFQSRSSRVILVLLCNGWSWFVDRWLRRVEAVRIRISKSISCSVLGDGISFSANSSAGKQSGGVSAQDGPSQ